MLNIRRHKGLQEQSKQFIDKTSGKGAGAGGAGAGRVVKEIQNSARPIVARIQKQERGRDRARHGF